VYSEISMKTLSEFYLENTSSPVAEMGDRLATKDMGRKVGAAVPHFGESWVPI